jgi:hypothetical protein
MDFQSPDDFAGGVAEGPVFLCGIEGDRGLEGVVVEMTLDPEIARVVEGEEGLVGRAGGRGAFDVVSCILSLQPPPQPP